MAGQRCGRKIQGSFTIFSQVGILRIPFLPFSNPALRLQPPARLMYLWYVPLNCQITVMDANSLPFLPASLPSLCCLWAHSFLIHCPILDHLCLLPFLTCTVVAIDSSLPSFLLSSLTPFSPNSTRTLNPIG